MPGKRHHYVPRLLLRRFAVEPKADTAVIWHLAKASGQTRRSNIINEAVIGRYYRMTLQDGTVVDEADLLLDRIEEMVSEVLPRLVDPSYVVSGDDFFRLMLFILTLKQRTPQAREALAEADARFAEMMLEQRLEDRDAYHREYGDGRPPEQVEKERLNYLDEVRSGSIFLESTPDREVALMFGGLDEKTAMLLDALDMTCMRVPAGSRKVFIVSDHPVSHYDPTPKSPDAGVSFMSSPNSVTWVPLDPKFGLLFGQRRPGDWRVEEVDERAVDELNMQTYAWARESIYGSSQEAVTSVRALAKRNRAVMSELRYRPARVWLGRGPRESDSFVDFTSRFRNETVKQRFVVREPPD